MKKIPIHTILYTAMFLMAGLLIVAASRQSNQAVLSKPFPVPFTGEYSQNGQEWKTIDSETDLSAYEGEVTLRGSFLGMQGAEMKFYLNHIGMRIYRNGKMLYESSMEKSADMCGSTWVSWEVPKTSAKEIFEIQLWNPHKYGNRDAYNQFLHTIYIGNDVIMKNYFEKKAMPYRSVSIFILVVSIALIGTAIGYRLLRLPNNSLLLQAGIMSLMMGVYMYLDARDISLWSVQIAFHTCARRIAMMTAAWLMGACVAELLHGKSKKVAKIAVYVLMCVDFILMAVSFSREIVLYDTGIYWVIVQGMVSLFLLVLTILEVKDREKRRGLLQPSAIALLAAWLFEVVNSGTGWWQSGICMKSIFTILFVFHIIRAVWLVAKNQRDSIRAEKLRVELKNSRIVLAMSQIRTHFVFNILNAISGMCEYDPQKADETLVTFSHYLRRNISIMEEDGPEDFTASLEHLEKYIFLEQVRFGEKIQFVKKIETDHFKIPPLVLQPLVENAIRHGILKKKQGGTVSLHTWEENGESMIEISDDGVGFETADATRDEAVGMKNVRFRLQYMMGGTMEVNSVPGQGTTVRIRIPGKQQNTGNGVKKK